jgi:hypothetical protein
MSMTSCETECDFFFPEIGRLEVDLENAPQPIRSVGDTLWFAADFPAEIDQERSGTTISEAGGLYVTRIFRIGEDRSRLLPALPAFTPLVTTGSLSPNGPGDDAASTVLRYTCPDGRCGFRQGFRLDSVGTYLVELIGSTYLTAGGEDAVCGDLLFGETVLTTPSNLAGVPLNYPLRYEGPTFFSFNIDTSFANNLLYVNVE